MSLSGAKKVFKMRKLLLILAIAVALVSNGAVVPFSGDAEKDAKACVEYVLKGITSCKSKEDLIMLINECDEAQKRLDECSKENKEYKKKFDEVYNAEWDKIADVLVKKMEEFAR